MNRPPKLFVGTGNVLCRDDGVGVRAAERMAALPLPPGIEVYAVGTSGLDAAGVLEGRDLVVIADAIDAGVKPGTLLRLAPEQLRRAWESGVSLHDLNLLDALAETRLTRRAPLRVVVFGVQIRDVSPGLGLSPPVRRALPRLLAGALREFGLRACDLGGRRPVGGRLFATAGG